MKSPLQFVMAVLATGWILGIAFMLYSEGMLDGSHEWNRMDFSLLIGILILGVPFVLAGLFCWLLRQFVWAFAVAAVVMVIASTYAFYSTYIPSPAPDGGWIFIIVPTVETFTIFLFSSVVYAVGRFSPRSAI